VQVPTGTGGARTNTFIGEVRQGSLNNTNIPAGGGFSMLGSIAPVGGFINTNLLYDGGANDRIFKWTNNGVGSGYSTFTYTKNKAGTATNWAPAVPQISVGEGFWLSSSAGQTWVRNFTVQ
jgi:hypothetical protein